MNLRRAINVARRIYPNIKPTKKGYMYNGDYYLEFAPLDYDLEKDGIIFDSFLKIDSKTGEVSRYNPIIDGIPNPKYIRKINWDSYDPDYRR